MINSLVRRFSRRQLHTIISKETIKPSSSTPSHLKTYNLSLYDQSCENAYMPMVIFYPKTGFLHSSSYDMTLNLKKSLSQTLTKYYPFAGRFPNTSPAYVNCNDDGVEFLETSIDTTLPAFLQKSRHEDLERFFQYHSSDKVSPLAVHVNHFECGGVAIRAALSHKIADGSSLVHFLSDWSTITRKLELQDDPHFLQFPNIDMNLRGFSVERSKDNVVKSFIFPNSKINCLKLKVKAMTAESIINLTRMEVLSWLLFKCAVSAATDNNSGCFKPTGVHLPINLRSKMVEPLPEKTIGNFSMIIKIQTKNENDMKPESFIGELRKQKMEFKSLKNIETAFGIHSNNMYSKAAIEEQKRKIDGAYICTSMCGYSLYDIDFGWGKPLKAAPAGNAGKNSFILMDTPNGDGIQVLACLGKQDMNIFQTNPELLTFC